MNIFENVALDHEKSLKIERIKTQAQKLLDELDADVSTAERSEAGRLMNMARTQLELCIMCAVKAVSRLTT